MNFGCQTDVFQFSHHRQYLFVGRNFKKMRKVLISIICFLTVISCRTGKTLSNQTYKDSIPIIDFCDLPDYKGRQVYIKCNYSGVDEYWGLGQKKCKSKISVNLEFSGDNPFREPKEFENVFREVHDNYYNSYLEIEAVGVFETDRKNGYGHLGSNNSRFVVYKLIRATLIRK